MIRTLSSRLRSSAFISACLLALLIALAPVATAQAPSQAQPQLATTQFLFVAQQVPGSGSSQVQGIATYTIDASTGALTPITAPPVQPRATIVGGLAINPAGTFLFASSENSASEGAVAVFAIAGDGSLTEITGSPFATSDPQGLPAVIAAGPNGQYIYVASAVAQSIPSPSYAILDEMSVSAAGALSVANTFAIYNTIPCEPDFPANLSPNAFYLHPTQKWLYLLATNGGPDDPLCNAYNQAQILQYSIASDGTLTPGQVITPYDSPNQQPFFLAPGYALLGSRDGTTLIAEGGPDFDLIYAAAFGVNPVSGALTTTNSALLNALSGAPPVNPGSAAIDSTGTYLFTTLGTFTFADGVFVPIDDFENGPQTPNPFENGAYIYASPTLPFLFGVGLTAGLPNGSLLSEQVNANGSLSAVAGSPYTIGATKPYPMISNGSAPIPTAPVLWLNPAPATTLSFTSVVVGQTASSAVTVTNQGYSTLSITNISLTGDPSLTQTNTCTAPLAPASTCTVTVKFAPTAGGTFTGSLTVASNTPTQALPISATAQGGSPDLVIVAPSPILFPDTQSSGAYSVLMFQIQNAASATAPLVISGFTIAGSNPGDFSETDTCTSYPIQVGSSCTISLKFTPLATGSRSATLSAASNATGSGQIAQLVGNGVTSVTNFSVATTVVGGGTVIQSPSGISLPNNTTVTLSAYPVAGTKFVSWSGSECAASTGSTCSFILTANASITATFTPPVFSLTTTPSGPGTITQSPTGTSFPAGTSLTFNAVPNTGATFTSWGGACAGITSTTCNFQMPAASTSVTATFAAAATYTLSATASGPGTITQSPTGTSFASGTAIALTAVPNSGASFTSWSGAECAGSTSTTCSFAMPAANSSITATFAAAPAVVVPNPSQTGSAGGSFTFAISTAGFATAPTLTASCTIPAGSCAINGTNLVVTTTAHTSATVHEVGSVIAPPTDSTPRGGVRGRMLVVCAAFAALLLAAMRRATRRNPAQPRFAFSAVAAFLLLASLGLLAACGGGSSGGGSTGTPAGTYTVKVTAVAGSQTAATNVSVTVQ